MRSVEYHYTPSENIELILTKGQPRSYPWHMHLRHWTVGQVRSGEAFLTTRTATRVLYAGQRFIVRPYEPHRLDIAAGSSLLVLCLKDTGARKSESGKERSLLAASVRALRERIERNPDEPLHIEQMAAYAGYSKWHFLRAFQKVVGMTPHAFQTFCRIRLLRRLLRADTASSLAAVSAGFSDQSHMHKVFRLHHAITPGEFKRASFKLAL